MIFQNKLDNIIKKNNSLVCVGLDSDYDKIPNKFKKQKYPQFEFNKYLIDQTNDLVCAYKPNSAFYEARGAKGITELKLTCDYLRKTYPEVTIILDAKRGDIGSTNMAYAHYIFHYLKVDAVTIQPYLGEEANRPFLKYKDKGIFVLCRTSNPGAGEFQDLKSGEKTLYRQVAESITNKWNYNKNCLLVVGATYAVELAEIRGITGEMTFLVPGIGTQGGDTQKTLKAGLNSQKAGIIINSSRGIIFSKDPRNEATKLRNKINKYR